MFNARAILRKFSIGDDRRVPKRGEFAIDCRRGLPSDSALHKADLSSDEICTVR